MKINSLSTTRKQSQSSDPGTFESNGRHIHLLGIATSNRFGYIPPDKCHVFESIDGTNGRFATDDFGPWYTLGHINNTVIGLRGVDTVNTQQSFDISL